ncbi:MAG: hypothetical protein H8E17_15720 [Deltaproteobacteria bacterium]|nr:hypothetical protein [Deltaproteobacteria bacterium]
MPNSQVLELRPDSAQSVLDILLDFEEEVKEALKQSKIIDFEPEPTNSPSSEKYLRLNIPQGPEKVIERCLALKLLREKVKQQHHLTHDERLFILFTMLAFAGGEGEKTVHELMQQASDYDFKRTQYFIDHAKHRAYKPFLCQKAQAKGICPLADPCPAVGDYRTPLGTVTGFNAANRAKVRPMVGAITTTLVTGTIEEIRHELPEITYKYLRDHEDKALLIQTDPGVGKTTTIAKAITNLPKDLSYIKRIFWAGQRHDMYDEVAEHIPNLKQILPKIGSDQADPDKNPEKYGLCGLDEKRKQLRTLRDKGWSEIETEKVCLDCYYGPKNCDYFQQWSHTGSFFAPQQHLVTSRIQKNKLRCDLIVVDEDPANVFDGETIVTQHDIDKMTEFLQDRKFAHTELMIRFLDNLRRSIASHKKLTQGHELLKTFDDKIRLQSGVDPSQLDMLSDDIKPQLPEGLHELINSINKTRFWIDWASFIEIADPKQLPKNWLAPLFKAIEQEKLLFGVKHNSRIYVKKQETQMVLGIFDTEIFNPENVPIIFLDATADPDTYRRIINRELVHIVHRVPLKNKIYQLIDGEYPKQSIMPNTPWSQRARNKLLKFTKAIIERGQKTLVVSTKDFHEMHLVKHLKHARLKRKYYTGYYRNLRGSNDYEKCDQVVLIGVALPNMAEIHIREQARRLQEDYISDETVKQYHQYGQSKLEGQTRVYEDERMNRVLEQHREYEMEQAIFRIRPLQNPEKKIWILSSIPLPLEANIKIINGEELSTILGLDMNKKHDRILRRMISSAKKILNEKVNKEFTVRRLANTAKVAEKTVRTYSKSICDAIPGLEKVHGGFKYNPPEIENPFE